MDTVSDEEAVRTFCSTGDDQIFMDLMNRYLPKLRRLLYTVLPGTPEDREDAEQEILVSLYRDLPGFRFRSSFSTYFYRYCRNKAIDLVRKNARERRKVRELSVHLATEPRTALSPERAYLDSEEQSEIVRAVMRLPLEDRTLIFLKDSEDVSIRDIAAVMSIPEGTVKSRLHRARERAAAEIARMLPEASVCADGEVMR